MAGWRSQHRYDSVPCLCIICGGVVGLVGAHFLGRSGLVNSDISCRPGNLCYVKFSNCLQQTLTIENTNGCLLFVFTWKPSYVQLPNFISHRWSSNGNHVMSILHVDLKMPGGTYKQEPLLRTTTFVGYVPSKPSSALLYISTSGFQMRCGGIRRSLTPPYSDVFHLRFMSFHSCVSSVIYCVSIKWFRLYECFVRAV